MNYSIRTRDQHLANDGTPKRILALDGGGLRGILTLGLLQKIENDLRARHGAGDEFRLCHYFDLMAGTSTGAIIAAMLALGWSVEELRRKYMDLGQRVFEKSLLRQGLLRAKYDEVKLVAELKKALGAGTLLGGPELKTGLLVMTKRMDTGSPWPLSNHPRGQYFGTRPGGVIGNGQYPLWQVVRASTAAPSFFDPERITIAKGTGQKSVIGEFVDGGVSPYNNPALAAVMFATMEGYRVGWPMGPDRLLVVSVGTGAADPAVAHAGLAAKQALNALLSLMEDSAVLQETMMQWLSVSPTARSLDRQVGDLSNDAPGGAKLLSYLRYNVSLTDASIRDLDPELKDPKVIEGLSAMDAPQNMGVLHRLGILAAERDIHAAHFPGSFDLPSV
ncbi:MAG: patatin-like phospholipase family protein [Verrucomicrobiales bacterium]|nr:patatin-like phospholipase family protein [Verrucomicrobiales bacterium]